MNQTQEAEQWIKDHELWVAEQLKRDHPSEAARFLLFQIEHNNKARSWIKKNPNGFTAKDWQSWQVLTKQIEEYRQKIEEKPGNAS